jgi:glycosyltransferase involved in cell wall biosynthesis
LPASRIEGIRLKKVIFIKPTGRGSPSIYSNELAKRFYIYPEIEIKEISTPLTSYREFFSFFKYLIENRTTTIHFPFQYYAKFALLVRKSIISVHDMWWVVHPYRDMYPNPRDWGYSKLDIRGIKGAAHIITPSNSSKKQIMDYLHIPPEKITVVYNGINHINFKPVKDPSPFEFDYILFVGSEQPRKNLKTLLEAFSELKKKDEFRDLKLVKVGGPERENFRRKTLEGIKDLGLEEDVIFTNYVKEEHLPIYYSNARCFIFPSLCEGFGLPTVESMACGCPVITANTSAFPEIVGDAGLMRDPLDARGFAKDIEKLLLDDAFRDDLIRKGLERAKMFSWETAAGKIEKVYRFAEE